MYWAKGFSFLYHGGTFMQTLVCNNSAMERIGRFLCDLVSFVIPMCDGERFVAIGILQDGFDSSCSCYLCTFFYFHLPSCWKDSQNVWHMQMQFAVPWGSLPTLFGKMPGLQPLFWHVDVAKSFFISCCQLCAMFCCNKWIWLHIEQKQMPIVNRILTLPVQMHSEFSAVKMSLKLFAVYVRLICTKQLLRRWEMDVSVRCEYEECGVVVIHCLKKIGPPLQQCKNVMLLQFLAMPDHRELEENPKGKDIGRKIEGCITLGVFRCRECHQHGDWWLMYKSPNITTYVYGNLKMHKLNCCVCCRMRCKKH